jgi:transposase
MPSGRCRRTAQSAPFNLYRRLRDHADDVLRFTTDPRVPFSHNLAEQAIRMPKVKHKIAGCFRTTEGVQAFCTGGRARRLGACGRRLSARAPRQ